MQVSVTERWWPTTGVRALEQLERGGQLSAGEQAKPNASVRRASAYSIVEGERYDWQAGGCMHIQPGAWHQHFTTDPDRVSQHIALLPTPLLETIASFPGLELVEDVDAAPVPDDYQPKLPWEFDYSVPWPKRP